MEKEQYLCIDLKSFFASCECIIRHLDPFTTPLVVANKSQGKGAITLAVTPYLKKLGIKGRTRLYEIPKNISYTIVDPKMKLYQEKSAQVVSIYLDYVAKEDLHIYSIDECFLYVTPYLKLYKKNAEELAITILNDIKKQTGLTATCGIGPNMLLAKLSMDIEAKKKKSCIAHWTKEDIPTKLWPITPLSSMWGIGSRLEKRLNDLHIFSVKDLACFDINKLKDKFGVMGIELWNHANGIDTSKISDFNKLAKEKSFSHSQVLFKDYYEENAKLIIAEMVEVVVARMRANNYESSCIGLGIGYSKTIGDGFFHRIKLTTPTKDTKIILETCLYLFERYYKNEPVRKISISCSHLNPCLGTQLSLFEPFEQTLKKEQCNKIVDEVKNKFGKNSILKGTSLLKDSTAIERNKKIGGHHE